VTKWLAVVAMLLALPALGQDGKHLYEMHCAACHQMDGAGAAGLAPPLQGTLGKRMAIPAGRQYLSGVLIAGMAGKLESRGVVYNGAMPGWAQFSDDELAAIANYVMTAFNQAETPDSHTVFTPADFAPHRERKPSGKQLRAWRQESEWE